MRARQLFIFVVGALLMYFLYSFYHGIVLQLFSIALFCLGSFDRFDDSGGGMVCYFGSMLGACCALLGFYSLGHALKAGVAVSPIHTAFINGATSILPNYGAENALIVFAATAFAGVIFWMCLLWSMRSGGGNPAPLSSSLKCTVFIPLAGTAAFLMGTLQFSSLYLLLAVLLVLAAVKAFFLPP